MSLLFVNAVSCILLLMFANISQIKAIISLTLRLAGLCIKQFSRQGRRRQANQKWYSDDGGYNPHRKNNSAEVCSIV